jgi:SAM-dependent methyltransferase
VPNELDRDWLAVNRANWDERVPLHVDSDFYDVPGFLAGADPLRTFEPAELGPVAGKRLLHLQCHFGLDTLAWARRGATVTGLDFSVPAIETARRLATRVGADDARFVTADVYSAPEVLAGERFDVVYTGVGALHWLPDLDRWARVITALLAPGGVLYLVEFHPVTDVYADDARTVTADYFRTDPEVYEQSGSYAGGGDTKNNTAIGFSHTLGDIVSAIAGAGLRIGFLHEFDVTMFRRYPVLEAGDDHLYRLPAGHPRIPLTFSIRATAPDPGTS